MKQRFGVKGVTAATPVRDAASAILVAKAGPLFELEGAASSGQDPEALHDMRVASRRLREAMALFAGEFPKKEHRKWYRAVRDVTRALGAVRDADVFIEALEGFASEARSIEERVALAYLIGLRRGQREARLADMRRRISRLDLAGSRRAFERYATNPRGTQAQPASFASLAGGVMAARLDAAYGFLPAALTPSDSKAQHAMRIACKRLRYVIEIAAPCLGDAFASLQSTFRGLQDALGELHDTDVFAQVVREAAASAETIRAGVPPEGLQAVLLTVETLRAKRFARFETLVEDDPEAAVRARVLTALDGAT